MAPVKQAFLFLTGFVQIAAEVATKNVTKPPFQSSSSALWHKFDGVEVNSNAIKLPEELKLPPNTPFGPEFMLVRGSGLWSSDPRSAAVASNSSDQSAIAVKLMLNKPMKIQGIHIEWLIPPSSYRIRGSLGTAALMEVKSWGPIDEETTMTDANFTSIQRLDTVIVEMKEPKGQESVSINFVAAIIPKISLVMIVSGITAGQDEFCLSRIGSKVFLTSCLTEIARHAGNELWRLDDQNRIYHAISGMLLALDSTGTSVVLANPDTVKHGSGFTISDENQLVYSNSEKNMKTCATLLGKSVKDLIKSRNRPVTASGGDDAAHLVDGDLDSVWMSATNSRTNKFSVSVTIPLESISDADRVKDVLILWKYPAESIILRGSNDGIKWQTLATIQGNRLMQTLIPLDPNSQTYLNYKLDLDIAHRTLSKVTAHSWGYGIREIEIRFHGLSVTLGGSCDEVYEASQDGRCFFFYKGVDAFSLNVMEGINGMTSMYSMHKEQLTTSVDRLADLNFESCSNRVRGVSDAMADLRQSTDRLEQFVNVEQEKSAQMPPLLPERCSDIDNIRMQLQHAGAPEFIPLFPRSSTLSFVPIQPRCAKKPLRMMCPSGHTLYTSELHSAQPQSRLKIYSVESAKQLCATRGLDLNTAALLTSNDGVELLRIMVNSTGVCDYPTFVPLAYSQDVLGLRWSDLSGQFDVTQSVYALTGLNDRSQGASKAPLFGYDCYKFTFTDWSSTALRAIVCALESMAVEPLNVPGLSCTDTLVSVLNRFAPLNTATPVSCPNKCFDTLFARRGSDYVNGLVTGSSAHGYSQTSSICLSAHHAGIMPSHKNQPILVNVISGIGLSAYAKQTSNGITSLQNSDASDEYSFKVKPLQAPCPTASSAIQIHSNMTRNNLQLDIIRQPLKPLHSSGTVKEVGNNTSWTYEPREESVNQRSLKALLRIQGQIYENINDYQTSQLLALNREQIMEARGWMKPIEKKLQHLNNTLDDVTVKYLKNSAQMSKLMRSILRLNENADAILNSFKVNRARLNSSGKKIEWRYFTDFYGSTTQMSVPLATSNISTTDFGSYKLISLVQLGEAYGTSVSAGGLEDSADGRIIMYQPNVDNAGVTLPAEPCIDYASNEGPLLVGNVLILKNEIKYDGAWSAKFFNPQNVVDRSRIGLVAKYRDFNNMLIGMLEQRTDGGIAKIVSVVGGREELLGSVPWEWAQLKTWFELALIKFHRDRYSLYIRSGQSPMIHLITIQSETWAGRGALGLYTNFATPIMMSDLSFKPSRCLKNLNADGDNTSRENLYSSVPLPVSCSLYEESFQNFKSHWITDSSFTGHVDWRIEFVKDRLAFVQRNAIPIPGATLLARPPLGCSLGEIRFSYLSPCGDFRLSALLRSTTEIILLDSTLTSQKQGNTTIMNGKPKVDEWTDLKIVLSDTKATVFDGQNNSYPFEIGSSDGQQFGLAVAECGGFAISNIKFIPSMGSTTNSTFISPPAIKAESEWRAAPGQDSVVVASFLELPANLERSWADVFVNREEL